jgi:hypothetical protein
MKDVKKIEEFIEKARKENKQKKGILAYWLHIEKRYIINYVDISFLKKDRKETLKVIKEIQSKDEFLFWANSPEGEKFYDENYNKIVEAIKAQQIKPWLDYEYGVKKGQ